MGDAPRSITLRFTQLIVADKEAWRIADELLCLNRDERVTASNKRKEQRGMAGPDLDEKPVFYSDVKSHLQTLLDVKEKQLQQAGTFGQRVLAQQMELEERIRHLQEDLGDESGDSSR
ncbi:hypothetical protein VNI00_015364 [Paramarasmius palmivorus]|uniref:Uncharacterized protein n=1 Tax=Paramarasmius palmivorus TaxID=297713 RepID=A0AAW0BM27_9AGAR